MEDILAQQRALYEAQLASLTPEQQATLSGILEEATNPEGQRTFYIPSNAVMDRALFPAFMTMYIESHIPGLYHWFDLRDPLFIVLNFL